MSALLVSQARVMATIGVTRGFGDHDLKVHGTGICIKPFLSCSPEVVSLSLLHSILNRVISHMNNVMLMAIKWT